MSTQTARYLHQIEKLLKEANYDDALDTVAAWPWTASWALPPILIDPGSELEDLRLRCMVSDIWDYAGEYAAAIAVLSSVADSSQRALSLFVEGYKVADYPLLKQQCWAVILTGMAHYRRLAYDEATAAFELAANALGGLDRAGIECSGTRSRLLYCQGLTSREQGAHREARNKFASAIELAGGAIDKLRRDGKPTASFDHNLARSQGLGIGWIASNENYYPEARSALVMARRIVGSHARFISAYIDTVHACIILSADSDKTERILEAIEILKQADGNLSGPGRTHRPYRNRVSNELALAYVRLARRLNKEGERARTAANAAGASEAETAANEALANAERIISGVLSIVESEREQRVYCAALLTMSRIHRERGDRSRAQYFARLAMKEGREMDFVKIDCYINEGEVAYMNEDYEGAITSFLVALKFGFASAKVSAVVHLHLCLSYHARNKAAKAEEHFLAWEALAPGIENAFIRSLAEAARAARQEINADFRIASSETNLDYDFHSNRLKHWLAKRAVAGKRTHSEAAKDLGRTVPVLNSWLKPPQSKHAANKG